MREPAPRLTGAQRAARMKLLGDAFRQPPRDERRTDEAALRRADRKARRAARRSGQ